MDEYETCLEACSEKELAHFYREYVQRVTEIIGPFITMIWFPVWCENDPSLAEKYPDEAAQGVQARKKSEQIFPRGDALIGRLLKRVNEKFLFEEPLLKALSSEELLEYLEDGKLPDRDTLKKRTESFIYSKQGITFVEPSREGIMATFAKLGYDYNIPDYSALEEIKGNVAYGGKVRGIVTVVMQKSLIKDFPEGGILVASMTTPEYVPAMKKAVAFITDEGGVTCHAAIVAREMKKPCIIGTKIATQVLHDGDLVEVDADNGVVRIIERAEENAPRYPLLVHDYDVPLNPWSSLNDVFQKYLPELSDRQVSNLDNIFFFRKEEVFRGPNAEHFEHAAKFFSEKLHKESGFIETISKTLRGVFQKVEAYSRKMLKTDFGAAESEVLYSLFDEGWTLYSKIWTWGMIGQFLEMGEDKLSDGFKRRIYPVLEKHGDPEAVFSKLVTPLESSLIAEEMVAVLNLAQEIQKSAKTQRAFDEATDPSGLPEEIRKQLEALADEYGWLQYYYAGPAADFRYYFSLIKKKLSADVQSEIRARIMETQELKAFQDSIERELSKEEKQTVIALREFSFLKEARKESQYLINYSLDGWYEEVATRLSSEPLYCRYILLSEFKRILVDHDLVLTHDDLMNRYSACAYVSFDGKNELKVGEEAEKYGKLLEEKAPTSDEQGLLKGSVAYPGVVTGRVKIVNAMRDMGKFEDGDVLVSVATTPAIVPAMNKAAAIVTDTGGVTCHAAIVAREMKKPCVIGTKVATRALHDGDLVEVDADNGVVRITERSKF